MTKNRGTAGYLGSRPNNGVTSLTYAPGAWIPVQISERLQDGLFPVVDASPVLGEILHLSLYNSTVLSGIGLLPTQGGLVSRTEYANLYNVIGTKYGAGDGVSTFGLPNLATLSWIQYTTTSGNVGTVGSGILSSHTHTYNGYSGTTPNAAVNPNPAPAVWNNATYSLTTSGTGNTEGNICKSADFVPYIVAKVITSVIPVGTAFGYLDTRQPPSIPSKYIVASGQYLARATYPNLFSILGTTYGTTGDTNFRVPDLRGAFICNLQSVNLSGVRSDEVANHTHTYAHASGNRAGFTTGSSGPSIEGSGTAVTGSAGGNETRPPNLSVIYVLRSEP
jgi:microcystin-dependent protein